MYSITAVLVGLLAVVSASSSNSDSLETCTAPPSSIEVCLSSIFASMEYYLSLVEVSLVQYEVSIHNNMHHEHTLLYSEVSWVASANRIAKGVKKAVNVEKQAISAEISELKLEYENIVSAYASFNLVIEKIENAISANIIQINNLKQEYAYIKTAKWQLYGYISAIIYEKGAVQIAINEVEKVVNQLNIQVTEIYKKISQLTKRQQWLLNWENKLYVDLYSFSKDVTRFRGVENNLVVRETQLYKEQQRLKVEITNARKAIQQLKEEYQYVVNYIKYLEVYETEINSIYVSVSGDARSFINAYQEFTCEDNLLYYEVCSSAAPAVVTPKPVPEKKAVVVTDRVVVTNVATQKISVTNKHTYTNKHTVKYTSKTSYTKTTNTKSNTNTNGNRKLLANGAN